MEVSIGQLIQLLGVTVSLLVVLRQLIMLLRDWRGGSPELRLLRDQLIASNSDLRDLLKRILVRLESL